MRIGGIGVQGHHDPAQPVHAADLRQVDLIFAEPFVMHHRGGAAQRAIKIIGPGMIGAGDGAGSAAPFQQDRHAVPADVGHGPKLAVTVAQHDDRLACDVHGQVVAGGFQRVGAARAEPVFPENMLLFQRGEVGRGIDRFRHRTGLPEGLRDIGAEFLDGGKLGVMRGHFILGSDWGSVKH